MATRMVHFFRRAVHARIRLQSWWLGGTILLIALSGMQAHSAPIDQAIKLHQRLTGVMPTPDVAQQMATLISSGQASEAARIAINSPFFYDLTLRAWAAQWSNIKSASMVDLNDATALIIGVVRDDLPFTEVLTGDIAYIGDPAAITIAYSRTPADSRRHFTAIVDSGRSLRDVLVRRTQSEFTNITDLAGIYTTNGFGEAWWMAGTNRRVFQATMRHAWCAEMEEIHDTSIPAIRIRRDVDRAPGGSPVQFQTKCLGCHATMDAATGAFAHFDYTDAGGLTYTAGQVQQKMNRNSQVYPDGFVTRDDSWMFLGGYSTTNSFSKYGWRGATTGRGLKEFATAISQSRGFSECMAKKVFEKACLRKPASDDLPLIRQLADGFEKDNRYNLKDLFVATATKCMD